MRMGRVTVSLAAAVAVGTGGALAAPAAQAAVMPSQVVPAAGQDASHSGSSPVRLGSSLRRLWKVDLGDAVGQPVVARGRVLVTSGGYELELPHRRSVHALDLATGKPLWLPKDVAERGVSTDGARAFVTTALGFEALDVTNGARVWTSDPTLSNSAQGALVPDGKGSLWYGAGDRVVALDAATGRFQRNLDARDFGGVALSGVPAVSGDTVTYCDLARSCARFRRDGSAMQWQHQLNNGAEAEAVVTRDLVLTSGGGEGLALSTADGSPRFELPGGRFAADSHSIAVATVGDGEPRVERRDARTGGRIWSYALPAPAQGAPLLTADRVLALDKAGTLHVLDRTSGRRVTSVMTAPAAPGVGFLSGSPGLAMADGVLLVAAGTTLSAYVGSDPASPQAPALVAPTAPPVLRAMPRWQVDGSSPAFGGRLGRFRDIGPSNLRGGLKAGWRRALKSPSYPVVDASGRTVVATAEGVYRLDPGTGATVWGPVRVPGAQGGNPAMDGNRAVVIAPDRRVHALDVGTGRVLWTLDLSRVLPDARVLGTTLAAKGLAYVSIAGTCEECEAHWLVAIGISTGKITWSARTPNVSGTQGAAIDGGSVFVTGAQGNRYAFNAATGAPVWARSGGTGGEVSVVAAHNGKLYTDRAIVDEVDGKVLGTYTADAAPVVLSSGDLVLLNDGRLLGSRDDGRTAWVLAAGSRVTGAPVAAGGLVYTATADGRLLALRGDTGAVVGTATLPEPVQREVHRSMEQYRGIVASKDNLLVATGNYLSSFTG